MGYRKTKLKVSFLALITVVWHFTLQSMHIMPNFLVLISLRPQTIEL